MPANVGGVGGDGECESAGCAGSGGGMSWRVGVSRINIDLLRCPIPALSFFFFWDRGADKDKRESQS